MNALADRIAKNLYIIYPPPCPSVITKISARSAPRRSSSSRRLQSPSARRSSARPWPPRCSPRRQSSVERRLPVQRLCVRASESLPASSPASWCKSRNSLAATDAMCCTALSVPSAQRSVDDRSTRAVHHLVRPSPRQLTGDFSDTPRDDRSSFPYTHFILDDPRAVVDGEGSDSHARAHSVVIIERSSGISLMARSRNTGFFPRHIEKLFFLFPGPGP